MINLPGSHGLSLSYPEFLNNRLTVVMTIFTEFQHSAAVSRVLPAVRINPDKT